MRDPRPVRAMTKEEKAWSSAESPKVRNRESDWVVGEEGERWRRDWRRNEGIEVNGRRKDGCLTARSRVGISHEIIT